ncbi:MAG: type II toxin-antitoxin system prevent-host-death family antitoxin [Propionibacteriaceae bacterium]|jgi:prevent-host-death family protein|nr:type II toxin-antitoxin system prevent-host-death family antitoxin [Propionibacteriaceae bacterium]
MNTVNVRELRNRGGEVLARVERGETLTVTSSGRPVARLVPLPGISPEPAELVARWRRLPPMSLADLRRDLDAVVEAGL